MITTILSDFSGVILSSKNKDYKETLNGLYTELKTKHKKFNFYDYYEFNEELLNLYTELKNRFSVNIFTSGSIQKSPEVKQKIYNIFNQILSANDLGLSKKKPDAYLTLAKKLRIKPDEIVFIDDSEANISAAKKAGMRTILFKDTPNTINKLRKLLL